LFIRVFVDGIALNLSLTEGGDTEVVISREHCYAMGRALIAAAEHQ